MTNPVFSTKGLFTPAQPAQPQYMAPNQGLNGYQPYTMPGAPAGYGPQGYGPQQGYAPQGYGPQQGYGPAAPWQSPAEVVEKMTLEDVLQKTAISLGALFLVAACAYVFLPDAVLYPAGLIGGLAAFIAPLIVARRRAASPAVNIIYAVTEGLLVGAFSKIFEQYLPGIIVQAVLGTLIAAGVVLVAYRFGGFRVSSKAAKIVQTGLFAFAGVALVNLILMFAGVNLGLFPGPGDPVSVWAWLLALVGVGLAVFSLVSDFQYVEAGIRMGAPRQQGWMAAFGLSVTMVWLYINLLRILSYIRR